MSTATMTRPETDTQNLWEVVVGTSGGQFFSTRRRAATHLADLARKRHLQGRTIPISVYRLNEFDEVIWNATTDVADVFSATGWPESGSGELRNEVINILEAILVSE